jgi:uncharacterized protein YchJ
MTDKQKALMADCPCGSGKKNAMCCGAEDAKTTPCVCGSGKMMSECCMKSPETHNM